MANTSVDKVTIATKKAPSRTSLTFYHDTGFMIKMIHTKLRKLGSTL